MLRPLQPPLGQPWLLYGILGCSLALNLVMVLDGEDGDPCDGTAAVEAETASVPTPGPQSALPADEASTEQTAYASTEAVALPPGADQWTIVNGEVTHSLARTFQQEAGEDGDALSAVYARLFVWDLDLRRDLQKGDRVEAAWRRTATGDIEISAARLHSKKFGRTFTAYRWLAPGDTYASYWQEDGTEVPHRLVASPLDDYEQITSLLKDRPTHKGMDFKVPVGTPVHASYAGTVTRVNWNWTANGNCIELRLDDGALVKYLHLSENKVEAGDRVQPGQVLALTGNTGRSTAPHLHYQINKGRKVVDPLDYHGTTRRKLDGAAAAEFQLEVARQDAVLGQAVAQR